MEWGWPHTFERWGRALAPTRYLCAPQMDNHSQPPSSSHTWRMSRRVSSSIHRSRSSAMSMESGEVPQMWTLPLPGQPGWEGLQ